MDSSFSIYRSSLIGMLSKLLRLIEEANGEIHLLELSQALGAQPSAVLGMVEMLQRKGRLTAVVPTCGSCDSCGLNKTCSLPQTATSYQLTLTPKIDHRSLPVDP